MTAKGAGFPALRRSRRRELRVEQDREGTAAIRTREHLPNGARVIEAVATERAAAADELVDERARWAQRCGRGEGAERLAFLREGDVRDDRRSLSVRGWCGRESKAPESNKHGKNTSAHRSDLLE